MGGSKWSVEGNDRRFRWISRALFSRVIRFETVGRSGFDFPIYFDLIRSSGLRGGDTLHSNLNFKSETRSRDNFCFQCVNLESKNNNNVWKRILYRYVYIYIPRSYNIVGFWGNEVGGRCRGSDIEIANFKVQKFYKLESISVYIYIYMF